MEPDNWEEQGLYGSQAYTKALGSEGPGNIAAMVHIDQVGAGPLEFERSTGDRDLVQKLLVVSASMKLKLAAVNVDKVGVSDYAPFRAKKVPTIVFHSVTQQNLRLLHTRDDNVQALKMDDYYDTYRTLAVYLSYLDIALDADLAPTRSAAQ